MSLEYSPLISPPVSPCFNEREDCLAYYQTFEADSEDELDSMITSNTVQNTVSHLFSIKQENSPENVMEKTCNANKSIITKIEKVDSKQCYNNLRLKSLMHNTAVVLNFMLVEYNKKRLFPQVSFFTLGSSSRLEAMLGQKISFTRRITNANSLFNEQLNVVLKFIFRQIFNTNYETRAQEKEHVFHLLDQNCDEETASSYKIVFNGFNQISEVNEESIVCFVKEINELKELIFDRTKI